MFEKKDRYILLGNDTLEEGKGKWTKNKQLKLKHSIKTPKHYYIDSKGKKVYLFLTRLNDSVKFDFKLFENYTDQLRQEVQNIESSSSFIMSQVFTKAILDIDKDQRLFLFVILFIMFMGGLGFGVIFGIFLIVIFFPCTCPVCPPCAIMPI